MSISLLDLVNGGFEAFGAWSAWANVKRLRRDRVVKGVVWQFTVVWQLWGMWNLYYYWGLHQYFSWVAGAALCAGNTAWLITLWSVWKWRESSAPTAG